MILTGRFELLDDADVKAVLNKDVVNALSAGTICPSSMYQHDVLDRRARCLGDRVVGHSKRA
jgi:hypothetical protein